MTSLPLGAKRHGASESPDCWASLLEFWIPQVRGRAWASVFLTGSHGMPMLLVWDHVWRTAGLAVRISSSEESSYHISFHISPILAHIKFLAGRKAKGESFTLLLPGHQSQQEQPTPSTGVAGVIVTALGRIVKYITNLGCTDLFS